MSLFSKILLKTKNFFQRKIIKQPLDFEVQNKSFLKNIFKRKNKLNEFEYYEKPKLTLSEIYGLMPVRRKVIPKNKNSRKLLLKTLNFLKEHYNYINRNMVLKPGESIHAASLIKELKKDKYIEDKTKDILIKQLEDILQLHLNAARKFITQTELFKEAEMLVEKSKAKREAFYKEQSKKSLLR